VIELEAGKATCHLGRSLVIAQALGLHPALLKPDQASPPIPALDLPDIPGNEDAND
jgi:hypothetical protein